MEESPGYRPYQNKLYSVAPGLMRFGTELGMGEQDKKVFQFGADAQHYLENKDLCRQENIHKYCFVQKCSPTIMRRAIDFMVEKLVSESPHFFQQVQKKDVVELECKLRKETIVFKADDYELISPTKYISTFDALSSQVCEDISIWRSEMDDVANNWMCAVHLSSPNYWSPEEKIGREFKIVHSPVAEFEKTATNAAPLINSMYSRGPYVRFAWGLSTDTFLNHHPEARPGADPNIWRGRAFDPIDPQLWVRTERQTIHGFKDLSAAFFTIRTYFEDAHTIKKNRSNCEALVAATRTMTDNSLLYKGLNKDVKNIIQWLEA